MQNVTVKFVRFTRPTGQQTDWQQLPSYDGDMFFTQFWGQDADYRFEAEAYHLKRWAQHNNLEMEVHEATVELPA